MNYTTSLKLKNKKSRELAVLFPCSFFRSVLFYTFYKIKMSCALFKNFLFVVNEMTVLSLPGAIFQSVLLETGNKQIFNNKICVDDKATLSRENHSLGSRHQLFL